LDCRSEASQAVLGAISSEPLGGARWHLFISTRAEHTQCLTTGRPPVIYDPVLLDCEFPFDERTEHDPKPAPDNNSFKRSRDLVSQVVVLTTMIEPPQYQEILALDATIRTEWTLPSNESRLNSRISMLRWAIFVGPFRAFGEGLSLRSAMHGS
jgi:hypothetical protein